MRRLILPNALGCAPILAVLLSLAGCGREEPIAKPRPTTGAKGDKGGKPAVAPTTMTAITPAEYGTLSGTVTLEGAMPAMPAETFTGDNKATCEMGSEWEKLKQTWLVNSANKGVANAVVFLKAPDGKYFKLKPEDTKRTDIVKVDQPHCTFIPHVVALFPELYDPETNDWKPSGQKLKIFNNAPINHNSKITASDPDNNRNITLNAGKSAEVVLKSDATAPINLSCDIHPWMQAKAWVFDHPYAAVTDKDGKFEIKNVPVGVPVQVVAWHEGVNFFGKGGASGEEMKLQAKQELNFKVSAK